MYRPLFIACTSKEKGAGKRKEKKETSWVLETVVWKSNKKNRNQKLSKIAYQKKKTKEKTIYKLFIVANNR